MSKTMQPIGQDGQPHRLCAEPGCTFAGRHVENCARCFGFGTTKRRQDVGHVFEQFPPRAASDLAEALASGDWERCPDCGGTPEGRKVTT